MGPQKFNILTLKHDLRTFVEKCCKSHFHTIMGQIRQGARVCVGAAVEPITAMPRFREHLVSWSPNPSHTQIHIWPLNKKPCQTNLYSVFINWNYLNGSLPKVDQKGPILSQLVSLPRGAA